MTDRDTKPPAPTAPVEDAGFLRRWSQRKQAVARGEALAEPVVAPAPVTPPPADPRDEVPLPDPASLTLADDFSAFLRPKVPAALKRQAMAQLFSHAHFNQVDGLDVYMDDYNLIPDMDDADRSLLRHARSVLDPAPAKTLAEMEEEVIAAAQTAPDDAAASEAEPIVEAEPDTEPTDGTPSADPAGPDEPPISNRV
ncbi:MAG: DUF3306 domain-containing protein [Zoogloeaceae bacterium]|uniref:DUF3306 domain-containing protein n=1 Tax=Denitromonas sp. TaxID=2734609 RepID=UPI001DB16266|nr:DUF3306 domain-containing protein [Rhodocyclaceae bacterium]MCP5223401.1 DUF3306 domain-containing protein [Zoogloeaceae bacterium]HPR06277.1 DUF3306 domain-containing protein [Denitromonas sp.]